MKEKMGATVPAPKEAVKASQSNGGANRATGDVNNAKGRQRESWETEETQRRKGPKSQKSETRPESAKGKRGIPRPRHTKRQSAEAQKASTARQVKQEGRRPKRRDAKSAKCTPKTGVERSGAKLAKPCQAKPNLQAATIRGRDPQGGHRDENAANAKHQRDQEADPRKKNDSEQTSRDTSSSTPERVRNLHAKLTETNS